MRKLLVCIAYFAWLGLISGVGIRDASGQTAAEYVPDYTRYVIVIDNTFSMRRYQGNIEKALTRWLDDGWGERASGGDGVSIWTYSKYGENALMETTTWRIRAQKELLDQSLIAMEEIRYFGRPKSEEILNLLTSRVATGIPLTVLWITDGKSRFAGTPFDTEIVGIFKSQQEFIKKAKTPFILTLESKEGEWAAWGVNLLTLETPPFLLPPSPAFNRASQQQSLSAKINNPETTNELANQNTTGSGTELKRQQAEERKDRKSKSSTYPKRHETASETADAELDRDVLHSPISSQQENRANAVRADPMGNPAQSVKVDSPAEASPEPVKGANPIKKSSIEGSSSKSDSMSHALTNTEDLPMAQNPTFQKEQQATHNEEFSAIPIKLDKPSLRQPADSERRKPIQEPGERLSQNKPGTLLKKPSIGSQQGKTVNLDKRNPLRYFGMSFLFLALALGVAWTTRLILFPQSKYGARPSTFIETQLENEKKGKGSLISATQKPRTKNKKSPTPSASKRRRG